MNQKVILKEKTIKWMLFCVIFFVSFLFGEKLGVVNYPYDAEYYWTTADSVFANGFDISAFPETFRGYVLPTTISLFKFVFGGVRGWRVLSSVCLAVCFSFSLPYLITGRGITKIAECIRVLLAYAVFLWIWGDFMQYPLSDFPAALCAFSGAAILRTIDLNSKSLKTLIKGVFAGVLLYAAYNTRAAYLYGVVFIIGLFVFLNRKNIKQLLLVLIALVIGVFIIAIPQCMINKQYVGVFSPKVYTEQLYGYSHDLQALQVYWGLIYPRYETYEGSTEQYPLIRVWFDDEIGNEIIRKEQLSIDNFSLKSVFKLILKYPMDMIGLYMRHMISLLTPAYREIYITNMYTDKGILASISILIWIVSGIGIMELFDRKSLCNVFWIFAVSVPALLQLFGAPELRFFIPLYLISYYYVFVEINYKELFLKLEGRRIKMALGIAIIYLLWITIFGNILEANSERTLIIHDFYEYQTQIETQGD
ncbi:MAG: hypothetical protein E7299_03705 [Lachnospiraceae bacterium]|nr:hypothetical protein [Lachnospiraceae bacterium]